MDKIVEFLNYLVLISIATERIVEILKKNILEKYEINSKYYQLISLTIGIGVCLLEPIQIAIFNLNKYIIAVLVGLMVSGGSSMWHELLGVFGKLKAK